MLDKYDDKRKPYRVWWNTNGFRTDYYIDKPEEAKDIIETLTLREVNDESVLFNACGLETFEDLGDGPDWYEWCDEDGRDIEDLLAEYNVDGSLRVREYE